MAAHVTGTGAAAQVVADGRTATTITHGGGITDIHTATMAAGHGVNTFSSFSTAAGSVTNIHVPGGAVGTVNIVNGPASVIAGAVRSVQGGTTGGDLYFANPAGIVVGPGGSFTAGSVALSTPSQDFAAGLIGPGGAVSGGHVEALLAGSAPQSGADIVVDGAVHGHRAVRMRAGGDILIGGRVTAGSRGATMAAAVNMGEVRLEAGGDVRLHSGAHVEGRAGAAGGHVHVRAGGSVRVGAGAVMLAEGEGAGHGGTIDVFGADSAFIEPGGLVSVAAHGTGDGGFVEYSAARVVEVEGALRAWSAGGRGGTVFIDPEHLTISGEITGGATFAAEATASITVTTGAIISTRRVSGDASDEEHATTGSTGDSGNIELTAPNITIQAEAQLLAFADNGYDGGNITLTAARIDREGHLTQALPVSSTSITIERAYLRAADILISAETAKFNQVDLEENINAYLEGLIPGGAPEILTNALLDLGQQAASRGQAVLDAINFDNWPSYLSARAEIGVNRSTLHADGQIRITSTARTETEITPETGGMALVIAASNTVARSVVTNSVLVAEGDVIITSDTLVEQRLRAEGVPGGGLTGLNTALVASVRMGGAETVLGGVPSAPVWSTRHFVPDGIEMNNSAVIQTGGNVTLGAVNTTDLSLVADTKLGENGRGAAIVLSLDDRAAVTAAGGEIWSNTLALDVHARNLYRSVLIEARVTGGAMEADDAPAEAVEGQPDAQQEVMAGVLGGVAASAEGGSGVGQAAGITDATQGGDVADRAYAASFALANHNATARVVLGDAAYDIATPGGGTAVMRGLQLLPMGGFISGSAVVPPTITRDFKPQDGAITILAENVLQDVRQRAIAAAGEVPEPGQDAETAAKRTGLVAVSFADWDLDAKVAMGTPTGWITRFTAGGGITITARNVAPDFAEREKLADAHDLYSGKRQAENPVEDVEAGAGDGEGEGEGETGNGSGSGSGNSGGGESGGENGGENGEDDATPNPGGILGAWSDGEGPLFSRAGEDDDDPLALSVAQTFAAGEALGIGISLARLSGDQTARVDLDRNVWIFSDKEPGSGLTVDTLGETVIRAVQRGAWGASAGAPGQATGAGEGGAYGASIALVNIEATTEALLRDGSRLGATDNDKGATVLARDTRLLSADARTHGAAGKTSFSGALSLMQRRDTTRALIAPLAILSLEGTLRVKAENAGDTVTVVSAAAAGKTSIGVGIALTFADRETIAGLVGPGVLDGAPVFNDGSAELGGLEVVAEATGNVISGGRTQAGEEAEAPAAEEDQNGDGQNGDGQNGGQNGDAQNGEAETEEEDAADAPVALDADAIGEDSTRVA
ncbi:MAG: leukotoxin LktA family filamentous adhesin, partial [Rhodobacteraceae bacterium]|nr:leukotoxin LktA family filamentous adhesin [Paracoccaceae bacterium]